MPSSEGNAIITVTNVAVPDDEAARGELKADLENALAEFLLERYKREGHEYLEAMTSDSVVIVDLYEYAEADDGDA